jgi:hypothetical protein
MFFKSTAQAPQQVEASQVSTISLRVLPDWAISLMLRSETPLHRQSIMSRAPKKRGRWGLCSVHDIDIKIDIHSQYIFKN